MAQKRRERETRQVRVSQSLVDGYRKQVDRQGDAAADYMDRAIAAYVRKYPDASTAQIRKFTYETMQAALPNFTDLAETLSCEFMSHLAEKYGWDDVTPKLYDTTDYKLVDKKLHYLADLLNEGDLDGFKSSVTDVTKFYVKRSAQESMIRNCIDASVRYARVPSGFETCSFCFMLASRGFVYGDEEKAGATHKFHPHCDCIVVPGNYGRTKIDGYDPQGMYDRWKNCAETIGVNLDADDEDTNKRIMREVETRDWHWLYTGEAPKIDYSLQPRDSIGKFSKPGSYEREDLVLVKNKKGKLVEPNEWRDIFAHDILSRNGFKVKARPSKAIGQDGKILDGVTTPDIEIDGNIWEIKSPNFGNRRPQKGNELDFIEEAMKSSKRNFNNPYDYKTKSGLGDMSNRRRIVLNMKYRPTDVSKDEIEKKILNEMKEHHVIEVISIDENGTVRRYKNG